MQLHPALHKVDRGWKGQKACTCLSGSGQVQSAELSAWGIPRAGAGCSDKALALQEKGGGRGTCGIARSHASSGWCQGCTLPSSSWRELRSGCYLVGKTHGKSTLKFALEAFRQSGVQSGTDMRPNCIRVSTTQRPGEPRA